MGNVTHFDKEEISKYKVFVETGTYTGSGASYLASLCERGYTIDVFKQCAILNDSITFLYGESTEHLEKICQEEPEDIVFWLDAHYPADYGVPTGIKVLPLVEELEIIAKYRQDKKDLILIDDLRIYETRNYQSGNLPISHQPGDGGFMEKVKAMFPGRELRVELDDEGYLSILPNANH